MQGQHDRIIRIIIAAIIIGGLGLLIMWWPAIQAEREYQRQSGHDDRSR